MVDMIELVAGGQTVLPAGRVRVRVTGQPAGVRLGVDGGQISRDSDGDITLMPSDELVSTVYVEPTSSHDFPDHTKVGLELITVAGASGTSPQVVVQQVDVGALVRRELARIEYVPAQGWRITIHGGSELEDFFEVPLSDERSVEDPAFHWLYEGRYALRRARNGRHVVGENGKTWGFLVDGSVSMGQSYSKAQLKHSIEYLCGLVVEQTIRLPRKIGVLGCSGINYFEATPTCPEEVAESLSGMSDPATWTLLGGPINEFSNQDIFVLLTDGPSSDWQLVERFAIEHPHKQLLVLVLSNSMRLLETEFARKLFGQRTRIPNLRFAVFQAKEQARTLEEDQWARVAAALMEPIE